MLSNLQSYTVLGIAALIWLPLSVVGFVNGGPAAVLAMSDAAAVVALGVSAFERWGWRWGLLHPHLIGTPDIRGTWRGVLESNWKDRKTKRALPSKVVYLTVRQTLTSVRARLLTDEAVSSQMAGSVQRDPLTDEWRLSYTYYNVPNLFLRSRSPEHRGGAFLTIHGEPAALIEGEYWTSRDTKGTLRLDARAVKIAPTFEAARGLFADRP